MNAWIHIPCKKALLGTRRVAGCARQPEITPVTVFRPTAAALSANVMLLSETAKYLGVNKM